MKSILLSLWLWITQPIILFFRNEYKRFKGRPAALRKAISKAKKLHKKNGKHYKVYFLENRYQILNRLDIQRKRRRGKEFMPHINITKLKAISFFDTQTWEPSDFAKELLNCKS